MKKEKIIVILGQTSTGKSDFAVSIAKQINGEILSADSRQVYKGMDLGTGKITKKEMHNVPHHLLDIISPKKVFSVSDFQKIANKKIEEIIKKNKTPIICGGTGFYIDTIINGTILPEVPPNKKLRNILENKSESQLIEILKKLDKKRASEIDQKNKVRLIRAIEIAKAIGKVPKIKNKVNFDTLLIGLTLPKEILQKRIENRLLFRIKKGMIKEVKDLHSNGISWKRMNDLGLEYRYVSLFLQNKITKKEMLEQLKTKIWQFSKRQKTWWKKNKSIIWLDPTNEELKTKIIQSIIEFLK